MSGRSVLALAVLFGTAQAGTAADHVVTPALHALRVGAEPEWADSPRQAEGPTLRLPVRTPANAGEWTLRLRQQDVRQTWRVLLDGKELGRLQTDENDQVIYLPVPAGALGKGEHALAVEPVGKAPDDIRVGAMTLLPRPVQEVLHEATAEITVVEAGTAGTTTPVPCRLTVLDAEGALAAVGARSGGHLAVRPGVLYTGTGQARFGLPAGTYTVIAGRGFAYGIDSTRFTVRPGDVVRKTLTIRREVPTPGHVSCDTHIHTLTHSGHGDATLDERVLTLAGEGIELPIATEHNRQVDYRAAAVRQGVQQYFTPVCGNEVTTTIGHFNIFPVPAGGTPPDVKHQSWDTLFDSIARTGARAIILNHARDRHSNFRPFGPERHLALTGQDLDGWRLYANAMEVVNSGAQQTDVLRLVRDWLGLLNRGIVLTPVGSSDSHDVSRYIVGQGRTYIRSRESLPGAIDAADAVENFVQGRVLVSCGLLAEITVNGTQGPGDLAPVAGPVPVAVRVRGPGWVTADRVELYANGRKVHEAAISAGDRPGLKWEGTWQLPRPRHDLHLVAVATGPGVTGLHWPIARPYQPTARTVVRRVIGVTGAVWLDGDGDGQRRSAYDYARRLQDQAGPEARDLVAALAGYDEAVAAQAAGLLQARGIPLHDPALQEAVRRAGPAVERGFQAFVEAWRESQIARAQHRGEAGPR